MQELERLLEKIDDVEQRRIVAVGGIAGAEERRVGLVECLQAGDGVDDDDEEERAG